MKVGIDFGTSTSEIAYVNPDGQVVLIPNHLGEFITPSVVYIQEDFTPIIGRDAKEKALIEPENAMLEVKRLFGGNHAVIARRKVYTPVEAAAMIIKYLADCAIAATGEKVDSAVVTVPAYFTDAQRKDVLQAGRDAGLKVDRIINEPTAASLDYGMRHLRECQHILIYDLGGGTLDVTVLELFEGVVDVKSSCGNNALGGKDFDQALMDYIVKAVKAASKARLSKDPRAMMRVKIAAEQCKIALSTDQEYRIDLPFIGGTADTPVGYSETITRNLFESLIKAKVYSTEHQIRTALEDALLDPADIDLVLMVGGSTGIPLVSNFLHEIFGRSPDITVDPDLAVVRGAAIQAGVLAGTLSEDAIVLTDICPHSLSTKTVRNVGLFDIREPFCHILIPRNATLPAEVSEIYETASDNQTSVIVTAYQGESEEPEENILLGAFELAGIPGARAGKEKIKICFAYNLNGILDISAEILSTGKIAAATVDTAKSGKNVDLSLWPKASNAPKYKKVINKAERMLKLHGDDADRVKKTADDLKKALVLSWEKEVCDNLKRILEYEIEVLEDELL